MKLRESDMPEETYWETLLDVPMILVGGAASMAVTGIAVFHKPASWQRVLGIALSIAGLFLLKK